MTKIILGIETSCDETGLALYETAPNLCGRGELAHHVYSQIDLHRQYGGVVPELASRDHINRILPLLNACLNDAQLGKEAIDVIAYTAGPGLLGALLCGASVAQSLAFSLNVPSIAIHHMEGHLLSALLDKTNPPSFPFVALLVSGGHTMLVLVSDIGNYKVLGTTLDDAVGEAFDKTAKLLGLPYPGGPELAKLAEQGNPLAFELPRPMLNRPGLDFSFSGLKTQVRLLIESQPTTAQADIAASFQHAVTETLVKKCARALKETGVKSLLIAGGVGANIALREKLQTLCTKQRTSLHIPPLHLCTDNGLMIAHAAAYRLQSARPPETLFATSKWSLDELTL